MLLIFFFNDTATTEIYTLSLHDALPICDRPHRAGDSHRNAEASGSGTFDSSHRSRRTEPHPRSRSEEHTSELQSQSNLVCRLLLEKKQSDRHALSSATHRT